MINFRKLKKEFSPSILEDGRDLFQEKMIRSAKIVSMDVNSVCLSCSVKGKHQNSYTCELEIDRNESFLIDSDCDCPFEYDCQHLAAVLFFLEKKFDSILVNYSKEANLEQEKGIEEEEKEELRETFEQAKKKEVARKGKKEQKELLEEYVKAASVLGQSPFFFSEEVMTEDKAELAVILPALTPQILSHDSKQELRLALRLPSRSKPLNIPNVQEFIEAVRYHEAIYLGNKRYFFGFRSFSPESSQVLKMIMDYGHFPRGKKEERNLAVVEVGAEALGTILGHAYDLDVHTNATGYQPVGEEDEGALPVLPCLYSETIENPLRYSTFAARLNFELEHFESGVEKLLLKPTVAVNQRNALTLDQVSLFECAKPGAMFENVYYRFQPRIRRKHLKHLPVIRDIAIPEPLFGAFVENALSELLRYVEVSNKEVMDRFVTLPFVDPLKAKCEIAYLDGELEAKLFFLYGKVTVPAALSQLKVADVQPFVTDEGVLARNLGEEHAIVQDLFQGFHHDLAQGVYVVKNDKKIVEFMTEVLPRNQERVEFDCPQNLLEQFIYDDTTFTLSLKETKQVDLYEVDLKVKGRLKEFTVDQLWDCLASKRKFIELQPKKKGTKTSTSSGMKILVLDLGRLAPIIQIFDELGIQDLTDHKEERPLWSLASIREEQFKDLPIEFKMSGKLKEIQEQMLGERNVRKTQVPKEIKAELRGYQEEGVHWLERLRSMYLSGILADDMGLGKTLQAIIAITQYKKKNKDATSIVICPTSLIYNWVEEFHKFHAKMKVLPIDGTPTQRKKLIEQSSTYDVIVTSYSLLQKDIEHYQKVSLGYAILDEAQHIKNRNTRNAKSAKQLIAAHRLILTGTPIENSLDELWSLFDFLMPGLLSSYDRFVEKYVRESNFSTEGRLESLQKKLSPFILRRMKEDVLKDLPPVTEILYHCHMTPLQKELYTSYAKSARKELSQLVKKEGFQKVQIQVLATLTRLKQICCHPAIFAKDQVEAGDSAKYDMLMELLHNLIDGQHKVVIFSQYTRMLGIIRDDLKKQGIRFCYLDGSTKNRMKVVKEFNEDTSIKVFLVSLKAGGTGLNLVGADTVIHFDMWWNPAVEDQATDRVHRIGQTNNVSSYKLVTLGSIEEKILEMQERKKKLVKEIIHNDEEAISKLLTWEEVLELLQT